MRKMENSNPFVCSPPSGVVAISAGKNITGRAWCNPRGAGDAGIPEYLPQYLNHSDHQAVGVTLREHCEVLALDYER